MLADHCPLALHWLTAARAGAIRMPYQPFSFGQYGMFSAGPLKGAKGIGNDVVAERVNVMLHPPGQNRTVPIPSGDLVLA